MHCEEPIPPITKRSKAFIPTSLKEYNVSSFTHVIFQRISCVLANFMKEFVRYHQSWVRNPEKRTWQLKLLSELNPPPDPRG